jgi:DNA-binding transcriptional ArsR family regulator
VGDVFKALADPTRRAVLDELAERDEQTLFELCGRLAAKHDVASSRQALSQHIDVLVDAGLVVARREGRYRFHTLDSRPLEHLVDRGLQPPPEAS